MSSATARIGGSASGMDINAMVDQAIEPELKRLEDIDKKIADIQLKQETIKQVENKLQDMGQKVKALCKISAVNTFELARSKKAIPIDTSLISAAVTSDSVETGTYQVKVVTRAKDGLIAGNTTLPNGDPVYSMPFSCATGQIVLGTTTINFAGGEDIYQVKDKINSATYPANSAMRADVVNNRLTIKTLNTGAGNFVFGSSSADPTTPFDPVTDDPDGILVSLGIIYPSTYPTIPLRGKLVTEVRQGTDVSIEFDGIPITNNTNSFSGIKTGLNLTVKSEATEGNSTMLKIGPDEEGLKQGVLDLESSYNELRKDIKNIMGLTNEKNEKIMSRDPCLQDINNQSRRIIFSAVTMGTTNWAGTLTLKSAVLAGASSITIQGLTNNSGTKYLYAWDRFHINNEATIYRLTENSQINGSGEATLYITPSLASAYPITTPVTIHTRTLDCIGIGLDSSLTGDKNDGFIKINQDTLSNMLSTDPEYVQQLLSYKDPVQNPFDLTITNYNADNFGVAEKLYHFIDRYTRISLYNPGVARILKGAKTAQINGELNKEQQLKAKKTKEIEAKRQKLYRNFGQADAVSAKANSEMSLISSWNNQK